MTDKTEYRISELENDMKDVCADLKKILENHLPHINARIAVIIAQMAIVMAGLAYLIFR